MNVYFKQLALELWIFSDFKCAFIVLPSQNINEQHSIINNEGYNWSHLHQKNMLKAEQLVFISSFYVWLLFIIIVSLLLFFSILFGHHLLVSTTRASWVNKQNKIKSWVFFCLFFKYVFHTWLSYIRTRRHSFYHSFQSSSILRFFSFRRFCEVCTYIYGTNAAEIFVHSFVFKFVISQRVVSERQISTYMQKKLIVQ